MKDPKNGKKKNTVAYSVEGSSGTKKDGGSFTATMKKGSKPGEQRSIYLYAMDQGTEYAYTWTPRSEAKVGKITPGEKSLGPRY